jgi:hypothetical protein
VLSKDIPHSYGSKLVVRTAFTGFYNQKDGLDADFKYCKFKDAYFIDTTFEYDDFRSVIFYKVIFENCDFRHSDMSQCSFYECTFLNCNLNETASFEVRYLSTKFIACSFERVIIRSGRIYGCVFEKITTTNRLFEDCIISDTAFDSVAIRLSTIIYNYGLTRESMVNCKLIDDDTNKQISTDDFIRKVRSESYTNLEKFKISYYLDSSIDNDFGNIENVLSAESFAQEAVNIESLALLSKNLTEFIFTIYNDNKIEVYYLLKLSYIFDTIVKHYPINEYPECIEFQKLSWYICHSLQEYLRFQMYFLNSFTELNNTLVVTSHDNMDVDVVRDAFSKLSTIHGFTYRIVARNSPHFIEILGKIKSFVLLMLESLKKLKFEKISSKSRIEYNAKDGTMVVSSEYDTLRLGFFESKNLVQEETANSVYGINNAMSLKEISSVVDVAATLEGVLCKSL